MARPISFAQRLALTLGAKQNQRPAFAPYGKPAAAIGYKRGVQWVH